MYLGEVSFILFICLLVVLLWADKKGQKMNIIDLDKKETPFLRNAVHFGLCKMKCRLMLWISTDRMERLKKIYTGKNQDEIYYLYFGRMGNFIIYTILAGLFLLAVSGFAVQKGKLIEGYFIERDSETGQERQVDLTVVTEDKKRDVKIRVPTSMYTKKELKKKFREATDYIDRNFLGENTSENQVIKPLKLITAIPESALTVSWKSSVADVVQNDGNVVNETLKDEVQVELVATISYHDVQEEVSKMITVQPPQKSREELFWEKWEWELARSEENSRQQKYMNLPQEAGGKKITYQEKKQKTQEIILVMLLIVLLMIPACIESQLRSELLKRERQLQMDYPDFVERFVLLIGAGLNVKGAWQRIVKEYENRGKEEKRHFVYEEMLVSVREMENGMSEARAYELFGKRTGLLPYMKFCTLIVQNLKKGSADLVRLLDYEVTDAFHERRENAKALGEEAGTKLLLPMMLMLSIVFALIMYAAFQSM